MELLLALLSLLTAATGAVAGARAPEAGVHQTANIVAAAPARRAVMQVAAPPEEQQVRAADDAAPAQRDTVSAAPLYANRRRE